MMLCPLRIFLNWYGGYLVDREAEEIHELMKIERARKIIHELNFVRAFCKQEKYIHPEHTDIELQLSNKGKWEIRGTVKTERAMDVLKKLNIELNSES